MRMKLLVTPRGLGGEGWVQIPKPGDGNSFIHPRHRLFLEENRIMEQNYNIEEVAGGVPVKMWTRGVPVEDDARKQLANAARLPIVFKHIAAMPDVHLGIGATVGSVIPTLKAIIPAAVGVDIGCGMMGARPHHAPRGAPARHPGSAAFGHRERGASRLGAEAPWPRSGQLGEPATDG